MFRNLLFLNLPKTKIHQFNSKGFHTADEPIPEEELNKLGIDKCTWSKVNVAPSTCTADVLLRQELNEPCIITFKEELDYVIRDEITCGHITEFCGLPGSGKTQVCLHLCLSVQFPKFCGGIEGEAIFLNTNYNFSSERLQEIALHYEQILSSKASQSGDQLQNFNFTIQSVKKKIHYFEAKNLLELIACQRYLEYWLEHQKIKLIVIDSLSYILRQISFSERVTSAYQLLRKFIYLADKFRLAVVVVNDMTTKVEGKQISNTPAFGESFHHCVNSRILFTKKDCDIFNASLLKSDLNPLRTSDFKLE